ncbi:hypothetical protein A9G00_14255 [Achromobacter xylosoxidans]|nr:hypothetical protein A7P23_22705 [Achromobacter xylosoxidans]ODA01829.1 hypothetical protein A9G00_14255 [Achromobacter xylosoxidans]CAB3684982.1 hypothetical protein LMG26696_04603 [Achromobacter pulmonis]
MPIHFYVQLSGFLRDCFKLFSQQDCLFVKPILCAGFRNIRGRLLGFRLGIAIPEKSTENQQYRDAEAQQGGQDAKSINALTHLRQLVIYTLVNGGDLLADSLNIFDLERLL